MIALLRGPWRLGRSQNEEYRGKHSKYVAAVTFEPEYLTLDPEEQAMLAGRDGPAPALAMRIVTCMAPMYGAKSLVPVTRAHVDGVILTGDAGLYFAERLANLGGRVAVPTSLNVMSMDRQLWRELGQDDEFAHKARRLGEAYLHMGATATFTCVLIRPRMPQSSASK